MFEYCRPNNLCITEECSKMAERELYHYSSALTLYSTQISMILKGVRTSPSQKAGTSAAVYIAACPFLLIWPQQIPLLEGLAHLPQDTNFMFSYIFWGQAGYKLELLQALSHRTQENAILRSLFIIEYIDKKVCKEVMGKRV